MSIFKGNCPAIITPFSKNGQKINYASFKELIDYQIKNNVSAIVFLGTTGESPTITDKEKIEICKFAVEYVNKKVPVIMGCGTNSTLKTVELAKQFEKLGADALLCVTPYYNKCSQSGLLLHYKTIAASTNLPIILYNVPGRTGVNIEPKTVLALSEVKNIVALKEASGNMNQIVDIISLCNNKLDVYSGDDNLTVPILAMGGKGIISVVSNIEPKLVSQMAEFALNGDFESASNIQIKLNALTKSIFSDVNPIPIKTALNIKGFNVGPTRLPLSKMDTKKITNLKQQLELIKKTSNR